MKAERHKRLLELIAANNVETQEMLVDLLIKEGFNVTQATVSRDIRELKLVKSAYGDEKARYAAPGHFINADDGAYTGHGVDTQYNSVIRDAVVSVDRAQNIIVVKTVPGMAMAVAAGIDAMHIEESLGCIAGDDTSMCVIKATGLVDSVKERIMAWGF